MEASSRSTARLRIVQTWLKVWYYVVNSVSISTLGDFDEKIEIELPIFSSKSSSVEIETEVTTKYYTFGHNFVRFFA